MFVARAAAFPSSSGVTLEIERAAARAFGVCISATKDSNSSFKVSGFNCNPVKVYGRFDKYLILSEVIIDNLIWCWAFSVNLHRNLIHLSQYVTFIIASPNSCVFCQCVKVPNDLLGQSVVQFLSKYPTQFNSQVFIALTASTTSAQRSGERLVAQVDAVINFMD